MNKNSSSKIKGRANLQSPLTRQFKSPISRSHSSTSALSDVQLKEQIEALQKALKETDSEITLLTAKGYKESELQTHIDKLHEYNEIKDVGQMVLGKIADLEGLQTKDMYERLDMADPDNLKTEEQLTWHLVGQVQVLKAKTCRKIYMENGPNLALFYVEPDKFFLTNAACPHAKGPLEQGSIEDLGETYKVTCPMHYYSFDLKTGESESGLHLKTYQTEIKEENLYALLPRPVSLDR